MIGEIVVFLKSLYEKHSIKAVIAAFVGILALIITPSDCYVINRIGDALYLIFIILATLIIMSFFHWLRERYMTYSNSKEIKKELQKQEFERMEKCFEEWRTLMDEVDEYEREFVYQFLDNDNSPIVSCKYISMGQESLFSYGIFNTMDNHDGTITYRLTDNNYLILKSIFERYGTISHFKRKRIEG